MLEYKNVIREVDHLFPYFRERNEVTRNMDGLPGLYLTFLIPYLRSNWDDITIQLRTARLMDKLCQSTDTETQKLLIDFIVEMYADFRKHATGFEDLTDLMRQETKSFMEQCLDPDQQKTLL